MRAISFFQGMCMGVADLLPGISGGTAALLMGFYQQLIKSIENLMGKDKLQRRQALQFLMPLGVGMLCSFLLFSRAIDFCLHTPFLRFLLFSFFFGAIATSTVLCLKQVKKGTSLKTVVFLAAALFSFFCTVEGEKLWQTESYLVPYRLSAPLDEAKNYDKVRHVLRGMKKKQITAMLASKQLSPSTFIQEKSTGRLIRASQFAEKTSGFEPKIVIIGILSACAMLLPGISGSTLLMAVGLYPLLIGALSDLSKGDISFSSAAILINFSAGALMGVLLFSRLVRYLFEKCHDYVLLMGAAVIVGTMPLVWPFWQLHYVIDPARLSKGLIIEKGQWYFPSFDSLSIVCLLLMGASAYGAYFLSEWGTRSSLKRGGSYSTSSRTSP
jgi:putative membrane protein